jgi:hypothetical protein
MLDELPQGHPRVVPGLQRPAGELRIDRVVQRGHVHRAARECVDLDGSVVEDPAPIRREPQEPCPEHPEVRGGALDLLVGEGAEPDGDAVGPRPEDTLVVPALRPCRAL